MKRIIQITIVTFALGILVQFVIYSFDNRNRPIVTDNYDDNFNFISHSVRYEWTASLYDLEKYEINILWFNCLSLAIISLAYLFTQRKARVNSPLDALERENEIIKKQIERKELLAKLENLEKK